MRRIVIVLAAIALLGACSKPQKTYDYEKVRKDAGKAYQDVQRESQKRPSE